MSYQKTVTADSRHPLECLVMQRFNITPSDDGLYVLYEDAMTEINRLREALIHYSTCGDGCTCGDGWDHKAAREALMIKA